MIMMMMMRRFVERVLNSPQMCCQSQSHRWVLRCRANARGESVAVRRAAAWQTVPDVWAGDRKTPHPQCCCRPWHGQCPGVSRPEMSLAGDSRNCMTIIDQVNWRQSMQAFVSWRACTWSSGELAANEGCGTPEWCGRTFMRPSPPEQLILNSL